MTTPAALVLAAGQGTRMKSKRPKVLHEVAGRPMVRHVVEALRGAGIQRIVVVVGHGADGVRAALGDMNVEFAVQEEQLGTGHAVMQAEPLLAGHGGPVVVTCGDVPLLRPETVAQLVETHVARGAAATVLSAMVDDPTGYGRVVRAQAPAAAEPGRLIRIVEHADASPEERAIREVNSGTYCFDGGRLFEALRAVRPDNAQGEYYLPDAVHVLALGGGFVQAVIAPDADEILGVNTRVELARAEAVYRRRIVEHWMLQGVTIVDPDTVYIDADVSLAPDVTVLPFTFIRGNTRIEEDCRIGPHADIADSVVERGAAVERAVVKGSRIGPGCAVGPYAYLRPGTVMEERARVGSFVEVKKSRIGPESKVPHLSYVGDAVLGRDVNLGAGTITCNWDGFNKYETVIEDGARIGSNTNLIAPVRIGKGAFTGAGSSIAKDVPADALAIERAEQRNIEGWAVRRRQRAEAEKTAAGRAGAPGAGADESPPADGPGGDKGTS